MKKIIHLSIILSSISGMSSCTKEATNDYVTQQSVQGFWTHNYQIESDFTMPPEYQLINFVEDSFYMTCRFKKELVSVNCFTDIETWYIKGKYQIDNQNLILDGKFTDNEFKSFITPNACDTSSNYRDSFKISFGKDQKTLNLYWLVTSPNIPESHKKIELNKIK